MAKNNNLKDFLNDLADGIRTKKGTTDKINPQDFRQEIESIETGIDTSDATATASDILSGKTAYVKDEKIEGTIETYNLEMSEGGVNGNTLKNYLDNVKTCVKFFNSYKGDNLSELIQYDDTENVTDFSNMYNGCENATSLPLINTSQGTRFDYMYYWNKKANSLPLIDTSQGTRFDFMYGYCESATSFPLIDTSNGTNFESMYTMTKATEYPLIDTSNGTDFSNMYNGCKTNSLPLIDTSNGTDFSNMYCQNSGLKKPPLIDTSNGTNFSSMFWNSSNIEEIPLYNLSSATNTSSMFSNNSKVTHFPAFDVRNVTKLGTTYNSMYSGCSGAISILMYGMKTNFTVVHCSKLEAEALVTILSNCQVITSTQTLTLGSTLLNKLTNVYVKETGVEQYEGITCRPCVICESTDEGAMLATEYFTGKGWTLA